MDDFVGDLFIPFWAGALAYLLGTMALRNTLDRFINAAFAPIVILVAILLVGISQFKIASATFLPYGTGAVSTCVVYERLKTLPESIPITIWVSVVLSPFLYLAFLGFFGWTVTA